MSGIERVIQTGAAIVLAAGGIAAPTPDAKSLISQVLRSRNPETSQTGITYADSISCGSRNYRVFIPAVVLGEVVITGSNPEPTIPYYSEWPQELLQKMCKLPVVEGLRLVRYSSYEEALKGCGGADACYNAKTRTAGIYKGAVYGGEMYTLAHERTHAHQHKVVSDALGEPSDDDLKIKVIWPQTEEGIAFLAAANAVVADHKNNGTPLPWDGFGTNPYEDFANVSAIWYTDESSVKTNWFRWPKLADFAATRLPK